MLAVAEFAAPWEMQGKSFTDLQPRYFGDDVAMQTELNRFRLPSERVRIDWLRFTALIILPVACWAFLLAFTFFSYLIFDWLL